MASKKLTIGYWVATALFALWLVGDGLGGVLQVDAGKEVLLHLGYPLYLLVVIGAAKLLAAPAILQTKFTTVKEWAYAGYAFNCLAAFASRFFVGDDFLTVLAPLVFLALAAIPYVLWKKQTATPLLA